MGGHRLGSYDLLSTVAAGESTFLARKRPFTGEGDRLYAIRLVDAETAGWATGQVGRGWFPNLGPVIEVGREGDIWFVVADVSDQGIDTVVNAARPTVAAGTQPVPALKVSRGRQGLIAGVTAMLILGVAGGAWAVVGGDDGESVAEPESESASAPAPAPATASASASAPAPASAPATAPAAAAAAAAEEVEAEPMVSKRILRARERQAAEREARQRRAAKARLAAKNAPAIATPAPVAHAAAAVAAKPLEAKKPALELKRKKARSGTRICPRTGRVLPN